MIKIKDIRIIDYLKLNNTKPYDIWFDTIPVKNEVNGKAGKGLNEWKFNEVVYLRKLITNFDLKSISKIYEICFGYEPDIDKLYIFEVVQWLKFVSNEIKRANEYEASLSSNTDPLVLAAGIEKMNKFEYLNTINPLAERYGIDPDDVAEWLWTKVITQTKYYNTRAEINQAYLELKQKQALKK